MYKTSWSRTPFQFPTAKAISYHLQSRGYSSLYSLKNSRRSASLLTLRNTSRLIPKVYTTIRMSTTGQNPRPILVVAGVGNGSGMSNVLTALVIYSESIKGTGAATA